MLLLAGLGNPGPGYDRNRHNIGFMAVSRIATHYSFSAPRSRFHGLLAEGRLEGVSALALMPQTFMNDSGRSIRAATDFFRIPPHDLVVFHDEVDLPAGKIRIKQGGGHAGHNGIRSIIDHLGPDFRRIRLGVGRPQQGDVHGHVLGNFTDDDDRWLDPLLTAIADAAPLLADGHDQTFANQIHLACSDNRPESPESKESSDGV